MTGDVSCDDLTCACAVIYVPTWELLRLTARALGVQTGEDDRQRRAGKGVFEMCRKGAIHLQIRN